MKTLNALLLVVAFAATAAGQETAAPKSLPSLAEARKLADRAVASAQRENFDDAYGAVKPYWPLAAVEIDGLANQMRTQWPMVQQRYGKSLATEFIKEEKVGDSFVRYIYLQKFERHALRWIFTFYRPAGEGWLVNGVSWDDGVAELFR